MKNYELKISEQAEKDINLFKKHGNLKALKKIDTLLNELRIHPYEGTGKPEALKYNLKGYWSRRIDYKNRLIYQVVEEDIIVDIVSAMGHYDDK